MKMIRILSVVVVILAISSLSMARRRGYGQYEYKMDIYADGVYGVVKKKSTDSVDFDYYYDIEWKSVSHLNWLKKRCLMMLEDEDVLNQILEIKNEK